MWGRGAAAACSGGSPRQAADTPRTKTIATRAFFIQQLSWGSAVHQPDCISWILAPSQHCGMARTASATGYHRGPRFRFQVTSTPGFFIEIRLTPAAEARPGPRAAREGTWDPRDRCGKALGAAFPAAHPRSARATLRRFHEKSEKVSGEPPGCSHTWASRGCSRRPASARHLRAESRAPMNRRAGAMYSPRKEEVSRGALRADTHVPDPAGG